VKYVAIDFETANNEPISPCSVGLAKMRNGVLIDSYYSLIKPPSAYFSPTNIAIHGIRPSDVALAPSFEEIWPDMLSFIADELLLAHNAPFDMGILKSMLHWYSLPLPPLRYVCTVRLARKVWPEFPTHRLVELSRRFGFDYQAHHALEDAINCALVFHKACNCASDEQAITFLSQHAIRVQKLTGGYAPLESLIDKGESLL